MGINRPPWPPPQTDASDLPFFMTVEDVAALLRTTPKAIHSRIERGLLPGFFRDGRRRLIAREDLLNCMEEKRRGSPGETR